MQTKILIVLVITILAGSSATAQIRDTTIRINSDTTQSVVKPKKGPVKDAARLELEAKPRRGAIQSAILPGYGNYKNKSWGWFMKVPAIYVGLGLFTDQFIKNKNNYKLWLQQAVYKQENTAASLAKLDPRFKSIELARIVEGKDLFRRNRDLCVLGGLAVYGINIVDAYIAGKFLRYDISPELTFKINPTMQLQSVSNGYAALPSPALKISLSFN
jgi:hypothetical protein